MVTLFSNKLKSHLIRCSVKYHRYQLAESKLSHTSYKFHIRTVILCEFWLEMKGWALRTSFIPQR